MSTSRRPRRRICRRRLTRQRRRRRLTRQRRRRLRSNSLSARHTNRVRRCQNRHRRRWGGAPNELNDLQKKQIQKLCVAALLSNIVYQHSPAVFDTQTLISLRLVMRCTYRSANDEKFIIFQQVAEGDPLLAKMKKTQKDQKQ